MATATAKPDDGWVAQGEILLLLVLILAAAALRGFAARGEFWYDEVYSLWLAGKSVDGPMRALFGVPHDNSHPLNTLLLWLMGQGHAEWVYRLPALSGTSLAVAFGWLAARRQSAAAAWITAGLLAFNHFLIHYGSEARGYGLMVAAAMTAYWLATTSTPTERRWRAPVFVAISALGALAHLSYLYAWAGLAAWHAWRWIDPGKVSDSRSRVQGLGRWLSWHGPVVLLVGAYWLWVLRTMGKAGLTSQTLPEAIGQISAGVLGFVVEGGPMLWLGTACLLLVVLALFTLWRHGDDQWVLFMVAILLTPPLAIWAYQPRVLFARFFLVSLAYTLLLLGRASGYWIGGSTPRRLVAAIALVVWLGVNTASTKALLEMGRGHVKQALTYMAQQTEDSVVVITSRDVGHVELLLRYYSGKVNIGRQFFFVPMPDLPPQGAQWLIVAPFTPVNAEPLAYDRHGHGYRYVARGHGSPLSGGDWLIYRRGDAALDR